MREVRWNVRIALTSKWREVRGGVDVVHRGKLLAAQFAASSGVVGVIWRSKGLLRLVVRHAHKTQRFAHDRSGKLRHIGSLGHLQHLSGESAPGPLGDLFALREGIANNLAAFQKLYRDKKFKALFGEIHGEKNKKLDNDYLEVAAQEPLIFNKQFYFYSTFEAETLLDPKLDQIMLECYRTGRPLELFFNQFIQRS